MMLKNRVIIKNSKPIATKTKKVDKDDFAIVEFTLTEALMQKAMQGEADQQLEFYVTVEYYSHKKHATDNVEVNNHFSQTAKSQPKQPSPPFTSQS